MRAQSQPEHVAVQAHPLDWEPPGLEHERSRVDRMAAELTPWGQVDVSARFDPSIRIRDYTGDGEGLEQTSRFSLSARVDFADRPSTHARALQTLERARNGVRLGKLRGVRDALLAHGYLLIAEERLHDADLELNETTHDMTRYSGEPYGAVQIERDEAELSLREAQLAQREALQDLAEARAEAAQYSLPAAARYEPIRFELPIPPPLDYKAEDGQDDRSAYRGSLGQTGTPGPNEWPDYRDSHEYRLLGLELVEAQAELSEAIRRPLDDIRMRGAYRARAGTIGLEGGIINGTPGLDLGVNTTGGPERWELEVSAQFVLDDSASELASLEQAVSWARQELESFPHAFERELEFALSSVRLAEDALTLAEEDVRLHEQRLALAKAALPDDLSEESAYADIGNHPGLARAEARLSAARLRMYRAWIAYVRDVASALELSGGQWQLAAPSE